ncbi:MAG: DUF1573 domain-containing protein [Muribaculaceae bacterium]|nr:DUF1573 domain-containing protein [Muribaculaceae bacterium]
MKQLFISAVMAILMAGYALASDRDLKNIKTDTSEYDFGLVMETDGPVAGEFKLINKGRKKFEIDRVKPSCGCSSVDFTHGKISKGDTATIKVTFDPSERPGKFNKGIYVFFSGEEKPIILRIKGTVMASGETLKLFFPLDAGELHFDTSTVDFGEMKRGLNRKEAVDIYNSSLKPISPVFSSDSNAFRFEMSQETIMPGEQATLTIYLTSSQLMWLGEKSLTIKGRWDGNQMELPVKVKLVP